MIKTCAICQKSNDFEDIIPSSKFTRPRKEEEKEYFNMWHRIIEVCPECGYTSYDVSTTLNKNIINHPNYKKIPELDYVVELNNYVPNRLSSLLQAGLYYNSINDTYNEALAYLQASDTICGVINSLLLQFDFGDDEDNKMLRCADALYQKALSLLEQLLPYNKANIELYIVYGGALLDGNEGEEKRGLAILKEALSLNPTPIQIKVLKYLLKM